MASLSCPIITLEEAWLSQHVRDFLSKNSFPDPNAEDGITGFATPSLMEFSSKRLASMDDNGISLQVVSHVPNPFPLDVDTAKAVNNELAGLIKSSPQNRFAAFATLPMAHPESAAAELRRCVQDLSFKGALIDSNCGGKYYDTSFYWPVFCAAEQLNVPIYMHPCPNSSLKDVLFSSDSYPDAVATCMSEYGWGWHNETAVHFLRLYAAGLFDAYPRLKIVLGHCGEMIPFQLDRTANVFDKLFPHLGVKIARGFRQVWDENVWVTTSGMFSVAAMACVLRQCKQDRVMFSVDYPFGKNEDGVRFLRALEEEGLVDGEGLGRLAYGNAEKLLGVNVGKI